MTTTAAPILAEQPVPPRAGPHLGRYPVQLPRWRDPRLAQSAVLLTVQVLGQTVLHFDVSIPQIAAALLAAASLEAAVTFARHRLLAWPASALLTGNGVALLLRDPATTAADAWSVRRLWLFAAVAALSVSSKYLLRVRGRHVFNPSNLGLVVALVALGPAVADVQVLYWGPWRPALALALAVIVGGAVVVGVRAGVWPVAAAYLASVVLWVGVLSASGHCIVADWSAGPLCGAAFWWRVALSPETLVFAAFMVTDPRTIPDGTGGRLVFAASAGGLGALFAAPQHGELATKVALLAGLTATSAICGALRWSPWRPSPIGRQRALALVVGSAALAVGVPLAGVGARSVEVAGAPRSAGADVGASEADAAPAAVAQPWPAGIEPPAVSVDAGVARWAPWFRPSHAEARARAVVGELEARRRAAGDPPVRYRSVVALMVKVPASSQDTPEVGVAVTWIGPDGSLRTDGYRTTAEGDSYAIVGPAEPWVDPPGD